MTHRRRRRRPLLLGGLLLVLIAASIVTAVVVTRAGDDETQATATVERTELRGADALVVRDGRVTLGELTSRPELADVLRSDGSTVLVSASLVVAKGGVLAVDGFEVRLASGSGEIANLEVRGGSLQLDDSTITSWDVRTNGPDTEVRDGRSSVLVTDGGHADVRGVRLVSLGDEQTDRHGFSIIGGSTSAQVSDTDIVDGHAGLTVSGNVEVRVDRIHVTGAHVAGVEIAGATGVEVRSSTLAGSAGDGILVRGGSANVLLRGNDAYANAGSGLALVGSSGDVRAVDNLLHRNGRAGVTVSNTRNVTLSANRIWDNEAGVSMMGGNSNAVVRGNEIGGNRGAGIESTSAGNSASIRDNEINHNEQGVVIADGSVEVRGNVIEHNSWGVAILDKSPRAVVRDNQIRDSADGGIRVMRVDEVEIRGNTIVRNRMAPFIVEVAGDSQRFQGRNSFEVGRKGAEWVYEPLRSISELADVTPVPAEFFSQPNVEYLLPVAQGGLR